MCRNGRYYTFLPLELEHSGEQDGVYEGDAEGGEVLERPVGHARELGCGERGAEAAKTCKTDESVGSSTKLGEKKEQFWKRE